MQIIIIHCLTAGSFLSYLAAAETIINGVKGELVFTDEICTTATSPQCPVASGGLCPNNMCASTTGDCNETGDGCVDLFGDPEDCEAPDNVCGDGYCGTPLIYQDCDCKDGTCYVMKFVPDGEGGVGDNIDGGNGDGGDPDGSGSRRTSFYSAIVIIGGTLGMIAMS